MLEHILARTQIPSSRAPDKAKNCNDPWPGESQELLCGAGGAEYVCQGEGGDPADPLWPQWDPARGQSQVSTNTRGGGIIDKTTDNRYIDMAQSFDKSFLLHNFLPWRITFTHKGLFGSQTKCFMAIPILSDYLFFKELLVKASLIIRKRKYLCDEYKLFIDWTMIMTHVVRTMLYPKVAGEASHYSASWIAR